MLILGSSASLVLGNMCQTGNGGNRQAEHALWRMTQLLTFCRDRLAPLHCCIAPAEHVSSSREVDEHVWIEMRNFKKCVIRMFAAEVSNASHPSFQLSPRQPAR